MLPLKVPRLQERLYLAESRFVHRLESRFLRQHVEACWNLQRNKHISQPEFWRLRTGNNLFIIQLLNPDHDYMTTSIGCLTCIILQLHAHRCSKHFWKNNIWRMDSRASPVIGCPAIQVKNELWSRETTLPEDMTAPLICTKVEDEFGKVATRRSGFPAPGVTNGPRRFGCAKMQSSQSCVALISA